MSNATRHIRHGVGSVRPYLYGRLDMLELVKRAFGAVELEHLPVGNGAHVEAKIGDSMLVMEVSDPPHPGGKPASIYVYVDDVDAAYNRALAAGATPISVPEDKPYQERAAGVKDSFGNIWYIATYTG
ncbi:MAG: VOC family protein, partial [Candidatus Binatus sp.]